MTAPLHATATTTTTAGSIGRDGAVGIAERPAATPARLGQLRPPEHPPGALAAALGIAGRTVRQFVRTPQLVVVGLVQGAMFLLIFRYVFGGAISTDGTSYVDFLVPGFITTGVLFAGTGAAAGVAQDAADGFADRLRSLPVPRLSILAGRALADTALLTLILALQVGIGFAVGFRLHGSVAAGLAATGLCIAYGFAFDWLFILIGQLSGNAQAAQGLSMFVFPLTFVSSGYVPVDSMPGWMQAFARNQPVTAMVDAVRALALGDADLVGAGRSTTGLVVVSLLWCVALVAVTAPLAAARLRRD
jgi:ABC transporter DrrB family efflux protein